jgi:hypothetical protein
MTLISEAQELIVVDPEAMHHHQMDSMSLIPLEVSEELPNFSMEPMEVSEPVEVEIVIDDIPGAPHGTPDPEPLLEVSEEDTEKKEDENEAKSKTPGKWDWSSKGAHGFIAWVKERLDDVPKHSGYDTAGLGRACSYLEKLDNEISKAMRMDLDGELDADKIEKVRAKIEEGIDMIEDRLEKVKKSKKDSRKKRGEAETEGLVKEGQKAIGMKGTFITVPLLISGIARICINGTVSAGHDMNATFQAMAKKYNLTDREKEEVRWCLWDMGYPLRGDRGFMVDEEYDTSSSDNFDFAANYKG